MTRSNKIAVESIIGKLEKLEALRAEILADAEKVTAVERLTRNPGRQTAKNITMLERVVHDLQYGEMETGIELLQELLDDNAPHRGV